MNWCSLDIPQTCTKKHTLTYTFYASNVARLRDD